MARKHTKSTSVLPPPPSLRWTPSRACWEALRWLAPSSKPKASRLQEDYKVKQKYILLWQRFLQRRKPRAPPALTLTQSRAYVKNMRPATSCRGTCGLLTGSYSFLCPFKYPVWSICRMCRRSSLHMSQWNIWRCSRYHACFLRDHFIFCRLTLSRPCV